VTRVCVAAVLLAACGGEDSSGELGPLPSEATLCKVWAGYENTDGSEVAGIHSDDLQGVLGAPASKTASAWTYEWKVDSGTASAVFSMNTEAWCYVVSGKTISPSLWVSDVEVSGMTTPKCWRTGSETPSACSGCVHPTEVSRCE
jgi:hypothetical protein